MKVFEEIAREIEQEYPNQKTTYWHGTITRGLNGDKNDNDLGFGMIVTVQGLPYFFLFIKPVMKAVSKSTISYLRINQVSCNTEKSFFAWFYLQFNHQNWYYTISDNNFDVNGDIVGTYELIEKGKEYSYKLEKEAEKEAEKNELKKQQQLEKNNFIKSRAVKAQLHYRDAEKLYNSGLIEEALEAYLDALKTDRTNYILYYTIGKCYAELGNIKDAVTYFEKSIKLISNDNKKVIHIKSNSSEVLFQSKAYSEAYNIFEDIYKKSTKESDFIQGTKYLLASGRINKVIEKIGDNIKKYPNSFKLLTELSTIPKVTRDKLKQSQLSIVNKVLNDYQKNIQFFENSLRFIHGNSSNNQSLNDELQEKIEKLNSCITVSETLTAKSEFEEFEKKINNLKNSIQQNIDKREIYELLKLNNIDFNILDKLVSRLKSTSKLLERFKPKYSKELNELISSYEKNFKTSVNNNNLEATKSNIHYAITIQEKLPKAKGLIIKVIDAYINRLKQPDKAVDLMNSYLKIFPNCEDVNSRKILLHKKKTRKSNVNIAIILILFIAFCIFLYNVPVR